MLPTNLTANILCQKHNNDLSPVDGAGLAAFNVFRDAAATQETRHKYLNIGLAPYCFPVAQYEIDGRMFERWLLKTLINYEISGDQELPIGPPAIRPGRPPNELVEIAFGMRDFQPAAGLYYLGRVGDDLNVAERVKYTSWIKDSDEGSYVMAGQFLFYGVGFLLNLDPAVVFPQTIETGYGPLHVLNRPHGFGIKLNEQTSERITFMW